MDNFIHVIYDAPWKKRSGIINMDTCKHAFEATFSHQISKNFQKTQMFSTNYQLHVSFGHVNWVENCWNQSTSTSSTEKICHTRSPLIIFCPLIRCRMSYKFKIKEKDDIWRVIWNWKLRKHFKGGPNLII